MLTKKQSDFVSRIIAGESPSDAYRLAFQPGTTNPDSLRAMASRERRKSAVASAIEAGLSQVCGDAIEAGVWDRRASMIYRLRDLSTIGEEMARKQKGMEMEIEGIEADPDLTPAQKKQRIGRVMQRGVVTRDLLAAKQVLYSDLDGMTPDKGESRPMSKIALMLGLCPETIEEKPEDYAAPPPPGCAAYKGELPHL